MGAERRLEPPNDGKPHSTDSIGVNELYVINVDGTGLTRLTTGWEGIQ